MDDNRKINSRLDLEEGWWKQIIIGHHDTLPAEYSKANQLIKDLTPEQKAKLNLSISNGIDIIKL